MFKTRGRLIPHLAGREEFLKPLGFTRPETQWITLVCLHSGLFTRDQAGVFLGSSKATVTRFVHKLLAARVWGRPVAADEAIDGRRICRIFGKALYEALEIPHLRHRREASIEVTRHRLLSLDFVLDHLELPWLATEPEKVACFTQLGIGRDMLPRRIYAGQARGMIHYFPLRMPVAVGTERAVFVYIDPGMGTRTELDSWGAAHQQLWEKLRETGRRVEVVAVAWEQKLLERARRRLRFWAARDISEAEKEILTLHQAIVEADWDTLVPHGGLDAVADKILQWYQDNPVPKGRGMIDDYRLWGSRRCRRIGAPFIRAGDFI